MTTLVRCSNASCGRVSRHAVDPLGRIFRCPRCMTKLPGASGAGSSFRPTAADSDSGWAAAFRVATAGVPAVRSAGGPGSGGVAVLPALGESGEFSVGAFDSAQSGEFRAGAFAEPEGLGAFDSWDPPAPSEGWGASAYVLPALPAPGAAEADSWPPTPASDTGLQRFRIMAPLGEGKHAKVFRAFDPTLERQVALKLFDQAGGRGRDRFLAEARALARLRHPRIVSVYEAGNEGGRCYLALSLIEGRSLAEILADGRLSHRRAAEIVVEVADALDYAHAQGVVHRDVKPANVRLDHQGTAYLVDFGIARGPESTALPAGSGSIVGTPAYLAPELAEGDSREAKPSADQYSLGVVLYEMLCGRTPFLGSASYVLFSVANHDAPCPSSIDRQIPRPLAEICRKATARRAEDRYASCAELAADLRRWLAGERPRACRRGWFA